MNYKTFYFYSSNSPQSEQQILCNSYCNPNSLFCRNVKADPKLDMELKGSMSSQNDP